MAYIWLTAGFSAQAVVQCEGVIIMLINFIGKFTDINSNIYELLECQQQIQHRQASGEVELYPGFKSYKTKCGIHVNVDKDGTFYTIDGIKLLPTK